MQELVPDADVFVLGLSLWMIVNEKVHDLIDKNGLTNVQMTEMQLEPRCT